MITVSICLHYQLTFLCLQKSAVVSWHSFVYHNQLTLFIMQFLFPYLKFSLSLFTIISFVCLHCQLTFLTLLESAETDFENYLTFKLEKNLITSWGPKLLISTNQISWFRSAATQHRQKYSCLLWSAVKSNSHLSSPTKISNYDFNLSGFGSWSILLPQQNRRPFNVLRCGPQSTSNDTISTTSCWRRF